ncbi:hypothetical protein LOTGIDRAFT_167677 [Lottia gigantea]|uniref:Farnesoic acid O-methyl transferase domain-containing protein n=1 Tax=Lottia gigantea TaxID=225164 RepID=V4BAE7_LOTGI|nr:hypothetical protein LOTGIDRAFT_167677 [Lottia gigantea]ESO85919.1 hypothetical protein LOTGIDRAFT_167677 [Lottia gigantea]
MKNTISILFVTVCFLFVSSTIINLDRWDYEYSNFIDIRGLNSKVFWIKGEQRGIVALFKNKDINGLIFEITFGLYNNKHTQLRTEYTRSAVNETSHPALLLNAKEFKPYWIEWNGNKIVLGDGMVPGSGQTTLSGVNTIMDDIQFNYLGIRTSSIPVSYILELSTCRKN